MSLSQQFFKLNMLNKHKILSNLPADRLELSLFKSIDSTNEECKRINLVKDIHVIIAEEQTMGKGRLGKKWSSPSSGNIYMSISSKKIKDTEVPLSLITGLICANSINKLIKKHKPKYIFHLAAQTYPKVSFDNPLETYDTNINGTTRLLEACKEYCPKAKIHICSSSEVYGKVEKKDLPINEDVKFHPASPYAISKVGTDLVGQNYALAYKMNIFITRMFTHTGPRRTDFFHESSFAKQIALLEKSKKRKKEI